LQDSKTVNGIPGLVDMPVLGNILFGSQHTDKESGELLIAMIPHIVRTPDYTSENLRGIYAGNDNTVKLYYAPRPEASPQQPAPSPQPLPGQAATPASTQPGTPQPTTPQAAPPATAPVPPAPPGQSRISFLPAAVNATVSGNVTVNIQLDNAADLFSGSPIKVKFDPSQLRLNEIAPGDLFTRDGTRVTSVKDIRNDSGEATITVARLPGSSGVTGSGVIAALNFVAIGKGSSVITISESALKNSQQQPINVTVGELPVKVQ
jgi:general secretion pathway protein D